LRVSCFLGHGTPRGAGRMCPFATTIAAPGHRTMASLFKESRMTTLDLSYMQARPVCPYQAKQIHLIVVGLGGNGSFLVRHIACLATALQAQGRRVTVTLIDPDMVEEVNIPRQNFCRAEIGRYKAAALAERYSDVFGLEIGIIPEFFEP